MRRPMIPPTCCRPRQSARARAAKKAATSDHSPSPSLSSPLFPSASPPVTPPMIYLLFSLSLSLSLSLSFRDCFPLYLSVSLPLFLSFSISRCTSPGFGLPWSALPKPLAKFSLLGGQHLPRTRGPPSRGSAPGCSPVGNILVEKSAAPRVRPHASHPVSPRLLWLN